MTTRELQWHAYAGTRTLRAKANGFEYILQSENGVFFSVMICWGEGGKYHVEHIDGGKEDPAKWQCQSHASAVHAAIEAAVKRERELALELAKKAEVLHEECVIIREQRDNGGLTLTPHPDTMTELPEALAAYNEARK